MIERLVCAIALLTACAVAQAQAFPIKPIRLIVSVQPGGNLDLVGRSVAEKISEGLGSRMFVENRPGANSTIGLAFVTVIGYVSLYRADVFGPLSASRYLYVLCAEVILGAAYLFHTYWIAMRHMLYANR